MNNKDFDAKLLVSRAEDLAAMAEKRGQPCFLPFLSDAMCYCIESSVRYSSDDVRLVFFGGYPDAEYRCAGFFPSFLFYDEGYDPSADFPISAICAKGSGFCRLSHRDFLGSIMSLGIKREMLGDILVAEDGFSATVFCFEKTSDYLLTSFDCAANDKIVCKRVELCDIYIPPKKFETISSTVGSPRVDSLISACFNLSREKASELVGAGLVSVDHAVCTDKSKMCGEGALVSVRHYGKFELHSIGDKNRRDRLRIVLRKFV